MRALSDTTVALVDEVNSLASVRTWPWKESALSNEISSKLARIAETGEWLAIPRIISLVLDSRRDVAEAAARTVKQLRPGVRIQDLGVVDRIFRELSPYTHPGYMRWHRMGAKDLKPVAALKGGATALQFAMCHPSGYVREEAIRLSAACADGAEIPILLLRTNDWVKPVQERAHSALRARLRSACFPELVAALPMLDQMRKWGRIRDRVILDEIDDLLRGPDGTTWLLKSRKAVDRYVRRAVFHRLAESLQADLRDVFESALTDDDPVIRSWAGRFLCDSQATVFLHFAENLLSNKLGAIRVGATQRLVRLNRRIPWERLLFDAHSGVRAVAQQVALDEGAAPNDLYRKSIHSLQGARLGAALIGLSETGGNDDANIVRQYLSDDAPKVRSSCLHALANFKVDDLVDTCLSALCDKSPSVAHTARDLLTTNSGYVAPASVWQAFETAGTLWGKKDALSVLSNLDYWGRLPYLLRALSVDNDEVEKRAALYMDQWVGRLNRVFTKPSKEIEIEARQQLEAPTLSGPIRQQIESILDSRGTGAKVR